MDLNVHMLTSSVKTGVKPINPSKTCVNLFESRILYISPFNFPPSVFVFLLTDSDILSLCIRLHGIPWTFHGIPHFISTLSYDVYGISPDFPPYPTELPRHPTGFPRYPKVSRCISTHPTVPHWLNTLSHGSPRYF